MNADQLIKHFERVAGAPDAVSRLRKFILDLAVRGKLVEQDPNDEPASALLKQIQQQRAIHGNKSLLEPPNLESTPYPIPPVWQWTQLTQIGFINPRNEVSDSVSASFVPMPMIFAEYGRPNRHEIRLWGEIKKGFTHFAEGDVGLAKITPCFENGKSTVFRGLTGGIGSGTTELHVIRPVIVSPDYILIFLKSPYFIETGIPKMTGTAGQKRVSKEYFAYSPFPLPPLAEQRRIVAKVDELMALCDELEAAQAKRETQRDHLVAATLHHLNNSNSAPSTFGETARFYFNHLPRLTTRPEHIKQLRQTILNLAIQGKVVSQDPNDEPASLLLNQVAKAQKSCEVVGRPARQRLLPEIEEHEVPFDVPERWKWIPLKKILNGSSQNGFSERPNDDPNGIPILRISAGTVRSDGIVAEEQHKLIGGIDSDTRARFSLIEGDLLACRFNGNRSSVGRVSVFQNYLSINPIYPDKLIRLRVFKDLTLPTLLRYFMNSLLLRNEIEKYCATTVGNWGISASNFVSIPLPLPPLAEQHRIVAKVDELMAICDELETQLTAATNTRCALLEATLHEALNGIYPNELVLPGRI